MSRGFEYSMCYVMLIESRLLCEEINQEFEPVSLVDDVLSSLCTP